MLILIVIIALLTILTLAIKSFWTQRTVGIEIRFWRHHQMATASLTAGQELSVTIDPIQANGLITEGATVSNVVYSVPDATVVSLVSNADGSATLAPTATVTSSAILTVSATVTDPDGTVGNFTATATITVTVSVSNARTVAIEILFTTITPSTPAQ
jgi:hypothetical protein